MCLAIAVFFGGRLTLGITGLLVEADIVRLVTSPFVAFALTVGFLTFLLDRNLPSLPLGGVVRFGITVTLGFPLFTNTIPSATGSEDVTGEEVTGVLSPPVTLSEGLSGSLANVLLDGFPHSGQRALILAFALNVCPSEHTNSLL
jgi:hypothetical protein